MLKNFADYFGDEALRPRAYFETDWPGAKWSRGGPVGIAGPGLLLAHGPAIRQPVGPRSTGPAPRPRTTGTATWTGPCGRASAPPRRCSTSCEAGARSSRSRCSRSVLAAAPAAGAQRARFDTRVLARIPPPGFPAMAYVHPNGRVYAGTYVNPGGDSSRSRVFEYDPDGTLLRSWTVPGQDLSKDHGVQVATSDPQGRLVLLDRTPARALLLDRSQRRPSASTPPSPTWRPARRSRRARTARRRSRIATRWPTTPSGGRTAAST